MRQVLLVEDDAAVREALAQTLTLAECTAVQASSFIVAKDYLTPHFEGVVVSDIRMPGRDGFHLLQYAQGRDPDLPVILLTGEGDIPTAVKAMGQGAFGFLEKPCAPAEFLAEVERALKTRALVLENRHLKVQLAAGDPAARLIFGVSDKAEGLREQVRRVARAGTDALVMGAPGTGISKVAEVIHLCSPAARGPFEKRAGAGLDPAGLHAALRASEGGTLFIDNIAALPEQTQFELVEALERSERLEGQHHAHDQRQQQTQTHGRALRVFGGGADDPVWEARLNPDLFYRLDVGRVQIPALSERPEDIPVLFQHYVAQAAEQSGQPAPEISAEKLAALMAQDWPGNARALMSAAMRYVLGMSGSDAPMEELGLAEQMAQVERSLLIAALKRTRGQASAAAQALKLPRKTLYDKLTRYAIKPDDFRS